MRGELGTNRQATRLAGLQAGSFHRQRGPPSEKRDIDFELATCKARRYMKYATIIAFMRRPAPDTRWRVSARFDVCDLVRSSEKAIGNVCSRMMLSAFVLMLFLAPAHASTEAAKKFNQILLDHEKAIKEATDPIEQRFAAQLDTLLTEAKETKDFDVVVRLTQVIEKVKSEKEDRDLKPSVIGTWGFSNKADGHTGVAEINADHTYTAGGKQIGRWEIREKQFIVTYATAPGQDRYSLPIKEEKMIGTNRFGHQLTLMRLPD